MEKTPLTSIISYIDLLKRENFTDPIVLEYLDILEAKAARLKVLTEDVVEASKASTGNLTLNMTNLDFVEMLHQVIGEFEERFEEHHLTMMVHFPDEPSVICADGQRMWRVLDFPSAITVTPNERLISSVLSLLTNSLSARFVSSNLPRAMLCLSSI